jgi:hypothetical protein
VRREPSGSADGSPAAVVEDYVFAAALGLTTAPSVKFAGSIITKLFKKVD